MARLFLALTPLLFLIPLTSCRTAPKESPSTVGNRIAESLANGDLDHAQRLFESIEESERLRISAYATLFDFGSRSYWRGDYLVAAATFRFLVDRYDGETSATAALVYSLFLARADQENVPETIQQELEDALNILHRQSESPNYWIHLIEAQHLADAGRNHEAAQHLNAFRSQWHGNPPHLTAYVNELEGYVQAGR